MHLCHKCNVRRKLEISNKFVCPVCENNTFLDLVYDVLIAYDPTDEDNVLQAISISFKKFRDIETGSVPIGAVVEECRLIAIEFRSIHLYDELTAMIMSNPDGDMDEEQVFENPSEELEDLQNKQIPQLEQEISWRSDLLWRNFDNLESFLSLIEIVKQQTKLSSEDIGIQIKNIKAKNPKISDLQALYYVSCNLNVFSLKIGKELLMQHLMELALNATKKSLKMTIFFGILNQKK